MVPELGMEEMDDTGLLLEEQHLYYPDDYYFNSNSSGDAHLQMSMKIVSVVLYSLTCLLGIPGNAFVIWITGLKMRRTVNTTWFLNLAVADLLCCLSIPFMITETLLERHWPYGNVLCKLLPSVIVLNMFASVFTLTLISIDRCLQVVKPVWSQNHRTTTVASVLCAFSWLLSMALSLPSMILRETIVSPEYNITQCTYKPIMDEHSATMKWIHMSRFVLGFLVPFFIIVVCYSLILRRVSAGRFSKSQKPLRIILSVIVAFFLCWLPYHVIGLVLEYGEWPATRIAVYLDSPSISLTYINSCLNPVLYVFMGQDFKEKVKLSLRRVLETAFSEATMRSSICSKGEPSQTSNSAETNI